MKKVIIPLLALGMTLGPSVDARAGDEGWAALGGFIGGTIFSGIRHHRSGHNHHQHHQVVVVEEPVHSGHYEYHKKKVWVPGYWSYDEDACGYVSKSWCPGHYRYKTVKVWVRDGRSHHYASRRHRY